VFFLLLNYLPLSITSRIAPIDTNARIFNLIAATRLFEFWQDGTHSMIGRNIGDYHITGLLAQGSMGFIYRGHHLRVPRDVVIRELALGHYPASIRIQLKARFRREIFALAQLTHPGIARVYHGFTKGDNYYIVMEFVQGKSLRHLLDRKGVPTPAQALYLCKQALAALDFAHNFHYLTESDVHRIGIIHRDLKPENILVDARGRLRIKNFGILQMPGQDSVATTSLSPMTSEYTPPEQLFGIELDQRSDIYSLGMTFYETMTGYLPIVRNNRGIDDRWGVIEDNPDSRAGRRSRVTPALKSILMRAIMRNPKERFQSAATFLKSIKEYEKIHESAEFTDNLLSRI
jgi:serine/threonine protein kinase